MPRRFGTISRKAPSRATIWPKFLKHLDDDD
jgi:hypothetical protein